MYIWMILATFIAILYSFSISFRSDIRDVTVVPRAEAVISPVIVRQQAAKKYMYSKTPPHNGSTAPTYVEGQITNDDIAPFVPYGFNYDNDDFYTRIYCIKKDTENTGLDMPAENCASQQAVVYVVTYGCIPARWRSLSSGIPNKDLTSAMRKLAGNTKEIGYARFVKQSVQGPDGEFTEEVTDKMVIVNRDGTSEPIPQHIVADKVGAGNEDFANICGTGRDKNECPYCLVFMGQFR